jgi:signal transduction histidine kinase
MILIEVADTGVGIAGDDLKRIFEPFQQAESTVSRRHEGTGLGLAIAKSLVELSDGTLAIESEVGVGTTIRVRLPAAGGGALRAIALAGDEMHASA